MHAILDSSSLRFLLTKAQVALKTVIDSFGAYAVEASLLGNLETVFNPKEINSLDDETIAKIASESVDTIAERGGLEKQLSILKDSLQTLQTLQREKTRRVPGMPDFRSFPVSFTTVALEELTNVQKQLRN